MSEYSIEQFEHIIISGVLHEIQTAINNGLSCSDIYGSMEAIMSEIHLGLKSHLS